MSIIAGVYCRKENLNIPENVCAELKSLISRNADDEIIVFRNERVYFAKTDIEAFGEIGYYTDADKNISIMAGDPLLANADEQNREAELIQIHKGLTNSDFDVLPRANGVFSLANYRSETLTLITDKLGIRPVYYWLGEDYIVFASALRILENFSLVPKKMNIRAVTEIAGLGYALSDRTPYQNVFLLKSAEILQIKNTEVSRSKYWKWDEIKISNESEETLLQKLYRRFSDAVVERLRSDSTTVAYLSGGLDSRCIVGALCQAKAKVHTFNFARPDTQDQILGRDFAAKAGTIHSEIPKDAGDHIPDYSAKLAESWNKSAHRQEFPAERPALAWSGEGGSVALGHVHLSQKIVDLMRKGDKDAAIAEYLQRESIYLSPKLLQKSVLPELSKVITGGIREELDQLNHEDEARNFYLYLILNDQRRKLAGHFENIDLHRLEFHLPFFDSEFLATIIALPLEMCLRHQFYVKWLYLFPEIVTSVSWQAYPGHVPCPLPIPAGLSYQWDDKYQGNEQKSLRQKLIKQGKDILKAKDFPVDILSKTNLRLALWVHQTGWRDYSYIIENAGVYYKYWRICGGNYQL